jgi:hypothetical protein
MGTLSVLLAGCASANRQFALTLPVSYQAYSEKPYDVVGPCVTNIMDENTGTRDTIDMAQFENVDERKFANAGRIEIEGDKAGFVNGGAAILVSVQREKDRTSVIYRLAPWSEIDLGVANDIVALTKKCL